MSTIPLYCCNCWINNKIKILSFFIIGSLEFFFILSFSLSLYSLLGLLIKVHSVCMHVTLSIPSSSSSSSMTTKSGHLCLYMLNRAVLYGPIYKCVPQHVFLAIVNQIIAYCVCERDEGNWNNSGRIMSTQTKA